MTAQSTAETAPRPSSNAAVALLCAAAALVLALSLLAAFRRGLADDVATALLVNGPRVLFAAAVGAAFALSGGLRLLGGSEPALREVQILAAAVGAAGGGWIVSRQMAETPLILFAAAAILSGGLFVAVARWLDRPRRWTNLALAALLTALGGIAAFAGTYARERNDVGASVVAWLLGDLNGATFTSGGAVLLLTAILAAAAWRRLHDAATRDSVALVAFALAAGAAGPLAFVATLAPRTVRWMTPGASTRAQILVGMVAGSATVAAVDAVPRLLLGGYDFPWNLPATMLAIPIFLGWNRMRLRREVGPASMAFEVFEVALIAGLSVGAIALAVALTRVIHAAT